MNIRLDGKHALVTGGNSGIGEAVVFALAEAGAAVAVNYVTNPDSAKKIADCISRPEAAALAIKADISDQSDVAEMFAQIDRAWGGLDILVNNAGIDGKRAVAWEAHPEDWRRVIEINLFGTFYCSREALERMVPKRTGVILNISSVHEVIAWSGYSAYTASKAAIGMMSKTLAQEAAPYGVRVLSIGPGAVKTPINRSVWSDPENMKDLLEKVPLKRIGTPEEIGRMAVALISDIASYVTGRTLFVDGGMTDYPEFSHGG